MQHAHQVARKHLSSTAKRRKEFYDTKVALNRYSQGDVVRCLNESRKVGVMQKLQPAYSGPFLVKRKITKLNYLLQLDAPGLERLVQHNKLKLVG